MNDLTVPAADVPALSPFASRDAWESVWGMAQQLARSSLVPDSFRGDGGAANIVIAFDLAHRMAISPFLVMQELVIVHGRPTWSSKFLIARVNHDPRWESLRFEMVGEPGTDSWGCYVWSRRRGEGDERKEGPLVTIETAKRAGWYERRSRDGKRDASLWPKIPELMLRYRAAAWWARQYAPECGLGMMTSEEAIDIGPEDYEIIPDATDGETTDEQHPETPRERLTRTLAQRSATRAQSTVSPAVASPPTNGGASEPSAVSDPTESTAGSSGSPDREPTGSTHEPPNPDQAGALFPDAPDDSTTPEQVIDLAGLDDVETVIATINAAPAPERTRLMSRWRQRAETLERERDT